MLSVIIPIYNVERYLKKCVDSVINQTLKDIEIILVDDGATDSCPEIADEYAKIDSRVKVIHKQNGGLMSAWKCGLENATGDIIGFVDSDDWVDPDMFEKMTACMTEHNVDLVCASLIREFDDKSQKEDVFVECGYYDRERIVSDILPGIISRGTMLDRAVTPNRVTKIFKAEILRNNLKYCDERISLGEDFVIVFPYICDTQSLYVMDFHPYHYFIRGTSIMGSYNPNFTKNSLLLSENLAKTAEEKAVYDFSTQLDNDLFSLVCYGIERNIASYAVPKKEMVRFIKESVENERVKLAFKNETVSQNNKKCKMYKLILKLFGASALYTFINRVVFFKRRHLGY